jgi:hypothetical protein
MSCADDRPTILLSDGSLDLIVDDVGGGFVLNG